MAITVIPKVVKWSVVPQKGVIGFYGLLNTWLTETNPVLTSMNTAIETLNIAISEINDIGIQVTSDKEIVLQAKEDTVIAKDLAVSTILLSNDVVAISGIDFGSFQITDGELIVNQYDPEASTPSIVDGEFIITY